MDDFFIFNYTLLNKFAHKNFIPTFIDKSQRYIFIYNSDRMLYNITKVYMSLDQLTGILDYARVCSNLKFFTLHLRDEFLIKKITPLIQGPGYATGWWEYGGNKSKKEEPLLQRGTNLHCGGENSPVKWRGWALALRNLERRQGLSLSVRPFLQRNVSAKSPFPYIKCDMLPIYFSKIITCTSQISSYTLEK